MPVGWLDAVTDTTIWGRVSGEEAFGPVGLRVEVDGQMQGFGRAGHVDPEGGPWRFAIHHDLRPGQLVSVYAVGVERELVLLEGSPRAVPWYRCRGSRHSSEVRSLKRPRNSDSGRSRLSG